MKAKRLLLLVMAICLASGVKAQFYDEPDDIYYYVSCDGNGQVDDDGYVLIFNFDGNKACELAGLFEVDPYTSRTYPDVTDVKRALQKNQSYYDEKIENTEYRLKYDSGTTYKGHHHIDYVNPMGNNVWCEESYTFEFLDNRNKLIQRETRSFGQGFSYTSKGTPDRTIFKKVSKSFFKVGRSRTPSGTMHE